MCSGLASDSRLYSSSNIHHQTNYLFYGKQDSSFEKVTSEDMSATVRPKVRRSWNLHARLSNHLEFFIMLSSSAGVGGSRDHGNYAAGNTHQDALANFRASKELVATSIEVGMILGVGFVTENLEAIENLEN